jgi:hypothetical protein
MRHEMATSAHRQSPASSSKKHRDLAECGSSRVNGGPALPTGDWRKSTHTTSYGLETPLQIAQSSPVVYSESQWNLVADKEGAADFRR